MASSPDSFTHNLYPGLDAELDSAYPLRGDVFTPGTEQPFSLQEAVATTIEEQSERSATKWEKIVNWAQAELLDQSIPESPLARLQRVEGVLGQTVPSNLAALFVESKRTYIKPTLERLYDAKQALDNSNESNPDGIPIGDTMHLALVPWKFFRDHLGGLRPTMEKLRKVQSRKTTQEMLPATVTYAIASGNPMYRNPLNHAEYISAAEYLDGKLSHEGEWGLILVQTSSKTGLDSLKQLPIEKQTHQALLSSSTFEIAGHDVGALGIFEWLALTMQTDREILSSINYTTLIMANRFTDPFYPSHREVLYGCSNEDKYYITWSDENELLRDARPRLAVL